MKLLPCIKQYVFGYRLKFEHFTSKLESQASNMKFQISIYQSFKYIP